MLVDPVEPLALITRPGRAAYRNWWIGADEPLIQLANRGIDLLEALDRASGHDFRLDRRGELLITADRERLDQVRCAVGRLAAHGLGPLREHQSAEWYLRSPATGTRGVPDGTDLLDGPGLVRALFGFLAPLAVGAVHLRRAGSFDGGRLARWLWREAIDAGVDVRREELAGIEPGPGGYRVRLGSGATVTGDAVVIAPEARFAAIAARLGIRVPQHLESDARLAPAGLDRVVPNDSPNLTSLDHERLDWSGTERARLERDPALRPLLGELPPGLAVELGAEAAPAAGWSLAVPAGRFQWPPVVATELREAMIRVLVRIIPGAIHCRGGGRDAAISGGYRVETADRRPLIGPVAPGVFWLGGFGRLAPSLVLGAAEMLARAVLGEPGPDGFSPDRFPARRWAESGARQTDRG